MDAALERSSPDSVDFLSALDGVGKLLKTYAREKQQKTGQEKSQFTRGAESSPEDLEQKTTIALAPDSKTIDLVHDAEKRLAELLIGATATLLQEDTARFEKENAEAERVKADVQRIQASYGTSGPQVPYVQPVVSAAKVVVMDFLSKLENYPDYVPSNPFFEMIRNAVGKNQLPKDASDLGRW